MVGQLVVHTAMAVLGKIYLMITYDHETTIPYEHWRLIPKKHIFSNNSCYVSFEGVDSTAFQLLACYSGADANGRPPTNGDPKSYKRSYSFEHNSSQEVPISEGFP